MTPLEMMDNWLQTFPLWDCGKLTVDCTDGIPGNAGLFPRGVTEISRRQDVTGRIRSVNRMVFTLLTVRPAGQDNRDNAQWLLALQQWIRQECARGNAPQFGDDAGAQRIWAEQGKLRKATQTGTAHYGVTVTVEFLKYD